jgi:hypothetical protein
VLTRAQDQITKHGGAVSVHEKQLGAEMEKRGKSLKFERAEIDDLLHLHVMEIVRRCRPLLSLLSLVDLLARDALSTTCFDLAVRAHEAGQVGLEEDEAEAMAEHAVAYSRIATARRCGNKEEACALPAMIGSPRTSLQRRAHDYVAAHLLGAVPRRS